MKREHYRDVTEKSNRYFDASGNPVSLKKGKYGIQYVGDISLYLNRNGKIKWRVDNLLTGYPFGSCSWRSALHSPLPAATETAEGYAAGIHNFYLLLAVHPLRNRSVCNLLEEKSVGLQSWTICLGIHLGGVIGVWGAMRYVQNKWRSMSKKRTGDSI